MGTLVVTYEFNELSELLVGTERYKSLYRTNNLTFNYQMFIGNNKFISIFVLK
jgi:hypothetical protein